MEVVLYWVEGSVQMKLFFLCTFVPPPAKNIGEPNTVLSIIQIIVEGPFGGRLCANTAKM